jgi:hypothetical protein
VEFRRAALSYLKVHTVPHWQWEWGGRYADLHHHQIILPITVTESYFHACRWMEWRWLRYYRLQSTCNASLSGRFGPAS